MQLKSQEMRKLAPELDPLRIGTGWTKEDLGKVQVMVESTYGDSHPGSGHLNILVEEVRKGIAEEGGFGARYNCTDICDIDSACISAFVADIAACGCASSAVQGLS